MFRAFQVAIATLAVLAAACARDAPTPSPTAPTPPPIAGQWQGNFVIGECPGYPNCGFVAQAAPPPDPWTIELTLNPPNGSAIDGTLVPHIWGPFPRQVPVSGQFVNGALTLSGRTSWDSTGGCFAGYPAGEFILRELTATIDARGALLTGSLTFQTYKALNSCYYHSAMVVVSRTLTLWPRA